MGRIDGLMLIVAICQEYKWTYVEYMQQPQWFLILIREKMVRDNKEAELQNKRMRHA